MRKVYLGFNSITQTYYFAEGGSYETRRNQLDWGILDSQSLLTKLGENVDIHRKSLVSLVEIPVGVVKVIRDFFEETKVEVTIEKSSKKID